jgi:hypothetical protein
VLSARAWRGPCFVFSRCSARTCGLFCWDHRLNQICWQEGILQGRTDTISRMFNFGKPRTAGDWIVHVLGAVVALFLVWWLLHMYVM